MTDVNQNNTPADSSILPGKKQDVPAIPKELQDNAKTEIDVSGDNEPKEPKQKRKHKPFFLVKTILLILGILLIIAAAFGIWNRWFRYNDEELLISNWEISGTDQVVVIDGKTINLGPDAVLEYTVDSFAKVLNYKIGDMRGQSHYRFSWDVNQVAIIENTSCDAMSTLFSDLGWFWDWATCGMSQIDLSPAYTKNNKDIVDTEFTGIDDIMQNGATKSILLDRIPTKKTTS